MGSISSIDTRSLIQDFQATLPWPLDPFQVEALEKLDSGRGVLVCAPTSSGKTVVAEYAIFRAMTEGTRAIYTTPLKALSNQKFRDFQEAYGPDQAGLVTGENTVNEDAPVVVMTTEILRNLIYEDPERLREVRYVVLDEVHYIDDFPRGSVWEEIIVQAPPQIKLVGLSATIGNHREISTWMAENRGPVETVFHEQRPVELKLWLSIQNQIHPLFAADGQIDQRTWSRASQEEESGYRLPRFKRMPSNDLLQVIPQLEKLRMLPAIYFIFSRRGCLEALQRCSFHGFDLTSDAEKRAIAEHCNRRLATLRDPDELSLYNRMVDAAMMRKGVAVHHAGLLPYHKELVEELFAEGLIKVVFATETLALGINMPARAVVVSSFTKFDGVNFSNLTTGELTQLMGRAGRRGIDTLGHGIILKESDVEIGTIYEVAMGEGLVVESKFLPNYNMALNLLRIYTPEQADALMDRSFGQFQKRLAAERGGERMGNLRARIEDLRSLWDCPNCTLADLEVYFQIEDRRRTLRIELRRLRREQGAAGRRGGRGRKGSQRQGLASKQISRLDIESRELQGRQRRLQVVHCPRFGEHIGRYGELRRLEEDLKSSDREITQQMDEYSRKLRRLRGVLTETGFIASDKPTEKGMLASRVYGDNTLLITEALWQGWFEGLTAPEVCAVMVMMTAEDRSRDRGPRTPRRHPTHAVGQTSRLVRSLYFRFSDIERDLDEPNLRPPSHDYIDFAYRWAEGDALDTMPLPPNVDIGDAIKAMKGVYSLLRQLDWALKEVGHPLRPTFRDALEAMERDVIKRT